jgi:hypothetical protein
MTYTKFKSYQEFVDYIKSLGSGVYKCVGFHGEEEYWLVNAGDSEIKVIYDNYSGFNYNLYSFWSFDCNDAEDMVKYGYYKGIVEIIYKGR